MLFNSTEFLIFLVLVFGTFWALPRALRSKWLLLASYFFYGWWDERFLILILGSTLLDYYCSIAIEEKPTRKRLFLALSIVGNLGVLAIFKYFNFFYESAAALGHIMGYKPPPLLMEIVLPVGISFYTFQTMAYTIEVFHGRQKAVRTFLDFALYVSFFPQLVAGPIERPQRLIPQLDNARYKLEPSAVTIGLWLILWGMFKKLAVGDAVSLFVMDAFERPDPPMWVALGGAYLFSLQIYADFSGYTDIARGTAMLFGVQLMVNFRRPYFATSFSSFWKRWHISLSEWFRDYVYIPLGGNRMGRDVMYRNLLFTMVIAGLWHGAANTFIAWGFLHGLFLLGQHIFGRANVGNGRLVRFLRWFTVFHCVVIAFVFFRASSVESAWNITTSILSFSGEGEFTNILRFLLYASPIVVWDAIQERMKTDLPPGAFLPPVLSGLLAAFILVWMIVFVGRGTSFIYFQF